MYTAAAPYFHLAIQIQDFILKHKTLKPQPVELFPSHSQSPFFFFTQTFCTKLAGRHPVNVATRTGLTCRKMYCCVAFPTILPTAMQHQLQCSVFKKRGEHDSIVFEQTGAGGKPWGEEETKTEFSHNWKCPVHLQA